ncbi:MAG: Dna2/Cas4 domain-containing protein, partial [Candidatus Methanosuratincola petrocarbonis]
MEITGTALNYLVVCPRKMWFFVNGISMERGNEYVEMGKLADKTAFSYNRRQIALGPIAIDVVRQEDGEAILFEIKRTSRLG